ncbi:hypothetical protein H4219_000668 [Mycoemilia scoparia]|uniref:Uncharacterized protein n=1 Tax=Mycoemilia scoparia TaxID=417184 RepID=A0A9W8A579_9FUNG|nr:hypothetical protein H4219_000668 [Mycoemilia scoparia]
MVVGILKVAARAKGPVRYNTNLTAFVSARNGLYRSGVAQPIRALSHFSPKPSLNSVFRFQLLQQAQRIQVKVPGGKTLPGRIFSRIVSSLNSFLFNNMKTVKIINRVLPTIRSARTGLSQNMVPHMRSKIWQYSRASPRTWYGTFYSNVSAGRIPNSRSFMNLDKWQAMSKVFSAQFRTLNRPLGTKWVNSLGQQQAMAHTLSTYHTRFPKPAIASRLKTEIVKDPKTRRLREHGEKAVQEATAPGGKDAIKILMGALDSPAIQPQAKKIVDKWASLSHEIPDTNAVLLIPFKSQLTNINQPIPAAHSPKTHTLHFRRIIEKLDSAGIGLHFLPVKTPFEGVCVVFPRDKFPTQRSVEMYLSSVLGLDIDIVTAQVRGPKASPPANNTDVVSNNDFPELRSPNLSSLSSGIFNCASFEELDDALFDMILDESIDIETLEQKELRMFLHELDDYESMQPQFSNRLNLHLAESRFLNSAY